MSSYIFYKIPYEGSLKKVKELIEEREWDFQIKVPKDGIILVKIPPETEEELLFSQSTIIDDETETKFGKFQKITEKEFEDGLNFELNIINIENNINEKMKKSSKKNKNMEYKRQISEILLNGDTAPEENKKSYGLNFIIQKIDLNELSKNIEKNYIDQYDYFFSQNHIFMCIFLAFILLVIFNF